MIFSPFNSRREGKFESICLLVSTTTIHQPLTFRLEPPSQGTTLLDGVSEGEGGPPGDDEGVRVLHTFMYIIVAA